MRDTASVRITGIRLERLVLPLDPAFPAAWDPVPRTSFAATIVRVETDEGVIGIGSGDTMDGFEAFEHLFVGAGPAGHRATRPGPRDDRLPRRPVLAARGGPLGPARQGRRAAGGDAVRRAPPTASRPTPRAGPCSPRPSAPSRRVRLRAEGFTALKIRIDPRRLEEGLASVTATRTAVGDGDGHHGRPQPGLADGRRHVALARSGRRPRDRGPPRRRRRAVGRGAAGRHGPARPGGAARLGTGRPDRRWRDDPDAARAARRARGRRVRRPPARRGADRPVARPDGRGARARAQPLVHAAHLDERHRPAGQPARRGRGRWRSVPRVSVRPAGLDRRTPRLHARRADPARSGRHPARPDAPGLGIVLDEDAVRRYAA